jgi:Tol biopolymer transport system component
MEVEWRRMQMKRKLFAIAIVIVLGLFISSCLMGRQSFTKYCNPSPQVIGFSTQTPVSFIFGKNNLYYTTPDASQDMYLDSYHLKLQDALTVSPVFEKGSFGDISPDRKWIVYSKRPPETVNLAPYDGGLDFYLVGWDGKSLAKEDGGRKIVDATENWDYSRWINKDLLLFERKSADKNYVIDQLIFMNPFSGEMRKYSFFIDKEHYAKRSMEINPQGTYLVYFDDMRISREIHLLELATGKENIIQVAPLHFGRATWNPSGTQFAVHMEKLDNARNPDTGYGLYIVNVNGKAERVVDLSTQPEYNDYSIINVEWSPDGRHIAFGVTTESRWMAAHVYDVESKEVVQLCYDFVDFEQIWSDDGHYLLAHKPYISEDTPDGLDWVLLDVESWDTWAFQHTSRLSPRYIWRVEK